MVRYMLDSIVVNVREFLSRNRTKMPVSKESAKQFRGDSCVNKAKQYRSYLITSRSWLLIKYWWLYLLTSCSAGDFACFCHIFQKAESWLKKFDAMLECSLSGAQQTRGGVKSVSTSRAWISNRMGSEKGVALTYWAWVHGYHPST